MIAVSRFFEAGRVYFLNSANKIQELHDQLMEFPNGAHDDMVDALVYAVRMLLVDGATQLRLVILWWTVGLRRIWYNGYINQ